MGVHPYWNEALMQHNNETPDILAIGDSWFWYPFNNLLNPINNFWNGARTVLALGNNGAEAVEFPTRYKRSINDALKGYRLRIQAVLVSGGGNDFAGIDDMDKIVRLGCEGAATVDECFQPGQPGALFDAVIAAYGELLAMIRKHCPEARVFVHNYDYAVPGKQDFIGFGQWLKQPMQLAGVPKKFWRPLVNRLIDDFGAKLAAFAQANTGVVFVNSAGVLKEQHWSNELHPTPEGFELVAKKRWRQPLLAALP